MAIQTSILLGIAFVSLLAFLGSSDIKTRHKITKLFENRPFRTDNEFYSTFFEDSKYSAELVTNIREIFNEQFEIDLNQLEPEDDLTGGFRLLWDLDSMADVEIVVELEKRFKIRITDDEAANSKSLLDLIELVYGKTEQGAAANP